MKTKYYPLRFGGGLACGWGWAVALLVVLLGPGCAPPAEESRHVELILSTGDLEPTTHFEVRFDEAVVAAEEVGRQVKPSPLVIEPPVPGEFTWISRRSGQFRPSRPLGLGTVYRFRLDRTFAGPEGRSIAARLERRLRTPALEVFDAMEDRWGRAQSRRDAELRLLFNAEVDPAAVEAYLEFRERDGRRMSVETAWVPWSIGEGQEESKPERWLTWEERFYGAGRTPVFSEPGRVDTNRPAHFRNVLVVRPKTLLSPGEKWVLAARKGLPAKGGQVRLEEERVFEIGSVTAFAVKEVRAHNSLEEGRRIAIRFSRGLDPSLKDADYARWIGVSPEPESFSLVSGYNWLELRGGYVLGSNYTVLVRAGLPGTESMDLERDYTNTVKLAALAPRLYFPQLDTHQMSWGRREFDLQTVNARSVRVQARQMDRHTLVHALRGYESYSKANARPYGSFDYREPYQPVDFRAVPGRVIYDQTFDAQAREDEPHRIRLDWNRILGENQPGAVLLMAEQDLTRDEKHARQGTQALIEVTDLGLTWKIAADQIFVHVFSHRTGLPVPGATLRLLTSDNELVAEAITDQDGLARLSGQAKERWLLAEHESDLHAVRLDRHQLGLYSFRLPFQWYEEETGRGLLLFTDREVYRPGETVHLKGLLRRWGDVGLVFPAERTGELRLRDPQNDLFLRTNVVITPRGSLAHDLILPEGTRGRYWGELQVGDHTEPWSFLAQDFQPNAFEVVLGSRQAYEPGERVEIPVTANYYLGAPLARGQVRWSLQGEDIGFSPQGFDEYVFSPEWLPSDLNMNRSSYVFHGEDQYSSRSNLVIAAEVPLNTVVPQPRSAQLRVELTDLNQQTIASWAEFVQHSSDFYLGLKRRGHVLRQGEAVPLELIAVRWDGVPLSDPVAAEVRVRRVEYHTVRTTGAGGVRSYRSEPEMTEVGSAQAMTCPVERFGIDWRVLSTNPPLPIILAEPGQYLIEARARDGAGHPVVTAMMLHVYGTDLGLWRYENETQAELVPDREQYSPGQTATVLIKTPVSGRALVTIERDRLLRWFVTELDGRSPALHVPILADDAPNVFVSVLVLRGAELSPRQIKTPEFRLGYCQLRVADPATRLEVRVAPDAPEYRPGDYVEVSAEVHDSAGQAVPDTEVTLYAVDEGILSLTGDAGPDPHAFFFRARPLRVQTGITLPSLLPEDPGALNFFNKGYLIGGGGRTHLRKDFLPCAFWNAELVTDQTGTVRARFRAPDSLTSYRVLAVAHEGTNRFGVGRHSFAVNKPLMVEPALPQFANVTDVLFARAVVHNRTGAAGQVEVGLQLDDKASRAQEEEAKEPLTRRLSLAAGESGTVEFPVALVKAGTATWVWRARLLDAAGLAQTNLASPPLLPAAQAAPGGSFEDAVQSTLKVGYITPLRREILLGRSEVNQTNLLAEADPQLREGEGTVTVMISNTRLSELAETVAQLLHYPYGCVEQTGSSLLPWIVLRRTRALWPLLTSPPPDQDQPARAGITRLLSMQTQDGGLAYWPGQTEPQFWGSAYGGVVLALARREALVVPEEPFQRLLRYLSSALRGSGNAPGDFSARCLAAYALALGEAPEPAYHEVLCKRRDELSAENRALLALAILEANGPTNLVENLLRDQNSKPAQSDDWYGCGARESAIRLLAWLRFQPGDAAVDKSVLELLQARKRAHWLSTQGNAWALHALTDYARRIETAQQATQGFIEFGNQKVPFQLSPDLPAWKHAFPVSAQIADQPLLLVNPSQHQLFTQVTLESRSALPPPAPENNGFVIRRSFQKLDQEGLPGPLDNVQVGDRILVTLRLQTSQPAHFVAVDDPLPAVFEAVNPEFKSQETGPAPVGSENLESWYSDFRELRADRVLFFRDHLPPGAYAIRYLARVRAAGRVTAPPATVVEMYNPERFGLTDTLRFQSLSATP